MCRLIVISAVVLAILPSASLAGGPSKVFPEFATAKDSLGEIALVADFFELDDVSGSPDKVFLDDCRAMAAKMFDRMVPSLEKKGYAVTKQKVASVGQVADSTVICRLLGSRKSHADKDEEPPVRGAPYFVDSALVQGSPIHSAWDSLARQVWGYERKKAEQPLLTIPAAVSLKDPLGADCAFMLLGVGRHISFGKSFMAELLSGATQVAGGSGNVSYSAGVDFRQFSGHRIVFAVVDLRSGVLLWMDEVPETSGWIIKSSNDYALRDLDLRAVADHFVKRLP